MLKEIGIVSFQIGILWLITQVSYFIADWLFIPIPGNVLGIFLLLFLLITGIIPYSFVERGARLLLKYLAFFFIPIAVGLMNFSSVFMSHGLILFFILVLSGVVGIIFTGMISQYIEKKKVNLS